MSEVDTEKERASQIEHSGLEVSEHLEDNLIQKSSNSKHISKEGGGSKEIVIASLICLVVLLVPMIYIEYRYDAFVSQYGEAREGAAGATLALAVVFRTVSRTVLRTIVRTSARAGMRASLKGALRTGIRAASRAQTKKAAQNVLSDEEAFDPIEQPKKNIKSLWFASLLLYLSWVIVIGFGQPYSKLLNEADSRAKLADEKQAEQERMREFRDLAIEAFFKEQKLIEERKRLDEMRVGLKGERDIEEQKSIETQIITQRAIINHSKEDLDEALKLSNNKIVDPEEVVEEDVEESDFEKTLSWLSTFAPYPGETSWGSMVIWLGGVVMFLPLWVIYFAQSWWTKREGLQLKHETGNIGGAIQLYFAGAFSFMPLTSDVDVPNSSTEQRARVAVVGLVIPTLIAVGFWYGFKVTKMPELLFVADAFLIYPMVQCFPLHPLEGIFVWRWKKDIWLGLFLIIMSMFMLAASEGLQNVI